MVDNDTVVIMASSWESLHIELVLEQGKFPLASVT